jgi:hypothetical protein
MRESPSTVTGLFPVAHSFDDPRRDLLERRTAAGRGARLNECIDGHVALPCQNGYRRRRLPESAIAADRFPC